ncbi:hypothetical protein BJ684DRAFT_6277, partial [Piptocephalis cylindrospora]
LDTPIGKQAFRDTYQLPRQPVILGPWATKHWSALRDWVDPSTGLPNWDHLETTYGDAPVSVMERSFPDWKPDRRPGRLYCKDWHFQQAFSSLPSVYTVPEVLADDWLNAWWDHRSGEGIQDDFRFAYLGYAGSWTSLHADVFRSHSWSANICGIKRWILFPPSQEAPLLDPSHPHLVKDGNPLDVQDYSSLPPHAIIYQYPGEVVFVPSGWYHQVENMGPTISLNHNWSNASNVSLMTQVLGEDLEEVSGAIQHFRQALGKEYDEHCQTLLRANTGWNCREYWRYLTWAV